MHHEYPTRVELRLVPQGLQKNLEWFVKSFTAEVGQTRLPLRLVKQRSRIQSSVGLGHWRRSGRSRQEFRVRRFDGGEFLVAQGPGTGLHGLGDLTGTPCADNGTGDFRSA